MLFERNSAWLAALLVFLVVVFAVQVRGQDDFGDDSDGGGEIVDMDSMMGADRKEHRFLHRELGFKNLI
jgi:hypothetical protein